MTDLPTPLPPGTPVPDFTLHTTPDQAVSLSDFRGQPVILAYYPADWSPVRGDQMSLYNEVLPEFRGHNPDLLGVSVDGVWRHLAFAHDRTLHFPLTQAHPHAPHAAEAVEAAATPGRFWEMHDYLFEHQRALDDDHLLRYAGALLADPEAFERAERAAHAGWV